MKIVLFRFRNNIISWKDKIFKSTTSNLGQMFFENDFFASTEWIFYSFVLKAQGFEVQSNMKMKKMTDF